MGLFSDIQNDIQKARSISASDVLVLPSQRIETLVADPETREPRRRTDYAGTTWYGGRPQHTDGVLLPGRHANIETPFWVPDSHQYEPGTAGDVQIQVSAAVQGGMAGNSGGYFQILQVSAALAEVPHTDGALRIYVAVAAVASLPFGVAYRVTVVCAPEGVR